MKSSLVAAGLLFLSPVLVRAATETPAEAERCARVTVSPPVMYRGRSLNEIPDITEPDLRLVNQLLSSGCSRRAQEIFVRFIAANPQNFHVVYHEARREWIADGDQEARRMLEEVLALHPDFNSARVLLAALLLSLDEKAEGLRLLDEAEQRAPTDVWIFMNRLWLESLDRPSRDIQQQALEIGRNAAFPPNVREFAIDVGKNLPNLSQTEYEQFLYARLDVESNLSSACKVAQLAEELSEKGGRFDEARKLLESPAATRGNCMGLESNRVLLAQAYLMQAARIDPNPGPANAAYVSKAKALLGGDLEKLAAYAGRRPQYATLKPFLPTAEELHEKNDVTKDICRAVKALDERAIRKHLEAGADPNGRCDGDSLVGMLVRQVDTENVRGLQISATVLLEHGARPDGMEACRQIPDCTWKLLPILQNYTH